MSRKTILIVDDDFDLRLGLGIRLRANDYEPVFAADGSEAVAQARRVKPDLVLLDLGLPRGDGFLVMKRMAAHPRLSRIPVIIISGRDRRSYAERALMAGAKALFLKPVNDGQLLTVIRQLLGESGRPHQHN